MSAVLRCPLPISFHHRHTGPQHFQGDPQHDHKHRKTKNVEQRFNLLVAPATDARETVLALTAPVKADANKTHNIFHALGVRKVHTAALTRRAGPFRRCINAHAQLRVIAHRIHATPLVQPTRGSLSLFTGAASWRPSGNATKRLALRRGVDKPASIRFEVKNGIIVRKQFPSGKENLRKKPDFW
jgi:hypothetical protein